MRPNRPLEHFLDHCVGLIDEFLDVLTRFASGQPDRLPVAPAPIEFSGAVGAQNAARSGGVGHQHVGVAASQRRQDRRHFVEAAGHANA